MRQVRGPTIERSSVEARIVPPAAERLKFVAGDADPGAFDRYRSLYSVGSGVEPIEGRFHAELDCLRLDRMMIHGRRLRAVSHRRDAATVRRAELEHFTVTVCLEGTMFGAGAQGYRRIRPGEAWLTDMTRPVQTRIEDARLMTLSIGREVVEAATGNPRALHATIVPAAQAAALTRALVGLADRAPAFVGRATAGEAIGAEAELTRLVGGMLGPPSATDLIRLERLAKARRFIDAHLDSPDLGVEAIAADLNVSRSTAYRLFEPSGGVMRFVQSRRLERLRRLLSERSVDTNLAHLVDLVGFASESHASRLFLNQYGQRPGAFRAGTRAMSDLAMSRVLMSGWLAALQ
ncbi:helix-turn-helix domain-containing protein [uncultured Sphingomonas sp.]|uniref:helix-turn-helix domain-containing protein n=1 Tax=uncultured Sphingomonas sp. TaxID=158754 RepID=UPI0035C9AE68